MIKLILKKIRFVALDLSLKLSLFINAPTMTAQILSLFASRVASNQKKDYGILCFGRSIFTNDIEALAKFGRQTDYYILNLHYWQVIFDHFVPATDRKQITESNYHRSKIGEYGKRRYYAFLLKFLPQLQKKLRF